jgi:3-oxoacyl-[acyl-carrier-protein] synthase II
MVAAPPEGDGLKRCMRLAVDAAGIEPCEVGYINAHATSTPLGDAAELKAIRGVFNGARVPVSSTKSSTGHLLGAAGGLGAIFAIEALRSGVLPPTINLDQADEEFDDLDLVGPEPRVRAIDYAMANGFGFGGVNASVLLKRWTT